MIVTGKINEIRKLRLDPDSLTKSWGFVPTMGYLHEGHLSLVQKAKEDNDRVVASIYVNPTQFAPNEDLSSYPRDLNRDLELLQAAGTDIVFTPADDELYPAGFQTTVTLNRITKPLEGSSRPTHFQGVATIVAKLFNIVRPTRAYFGQKDGQQSLVVKQMVQDLNFDLEIVVCPTVREADGLALSSRNKYLSQEERHQAIVLFKALQAAKAAFERGVRDGKYLRDTMTNIIGQASLARIDYVSAADPTTLLELDQVKNGVLFSTAVFFGKTRLIDNLLIPTKQTAS